MRLDLLISTDYIKKTILYSGISLLMILNLNVTYNIYLSSYNFYNLLNEVYTIKYCFSCL